MLIKMYWDCPACNHANSQFVKVRKYKDSSGNRHLGTYGNVVTNCDDETGGCGKRVVVDWTLAAEGEAYLVAGREDAVR